MSLMCLLLMNPEFHAGRPIPHYHLSHHGLHLENKSKARPFSSLPLSLDHFDNLHALTPQHHMCI